MRNAVVCLALLVLPLSAHAMTFETIKLDGGSVILAAKGTINQGDDQRLHAFVSALPASTRLSAVSLDSPGGNLREGVYLANSIRSTSLPTIVAPDGLCASACFLMFAAGTERYVFTTSRVGVHSASSQDGADDFAAQAVTTLMARQAAEFGVPPGIIGEMVTTPPSEVTWLSRQDLAAMHAQVLEADSDDYTPGSALRPGAAAKATPSPAPAHATTSLVPGVPADPAYVQGRTDRIAYERWFQALQGSFSQGAHWWAANRSQAVRSKLSCEGAPGAADPAFVSGCLKAREMLAPVDHRRLSEPLYKAGWNSL